MKGQKDDKDKLPIYTVLFKQFPNALTEVVKRSEYGHQKYIETDEDYMNFKRVDNNNDRYLNAALRHLLDWGKEDEEAVGTTHAGAVIWNLLAALEVELSGKTTENNQLIWEGDGFGNYICGNYKITKLKSDFPSSLSINYSLSFKTQIVSYHSELKEAKETAEEHAKENN